MGQLTPKKFPFWRCVIPKFVAKSQTIWPHVAAALLYPLLVLNDRPKLHSLEFSISILRSISSYFQCKTKVQAVFAHSSAMSVWVFPAVPRYLVLLLRAIFAEVSGCNLKYVPWSSIFIFWWRRSHMIKTGDAWIAKVENISRPVSWSL